MKQLLCPFDFSNAAINAVEYAAHLAQDLNMGLSLIFIEQVAAWHGVVPEDGGSLLLVDDQALDTHERLQAYATIVESQFKVPCNAATRVYAQPLADALGEEVAQGDFDLVVMGTSGADGVMNAFLGTNTYRLILQTEKPLLLVPESCVFERPSHILYATDYCPDDLQNVKRLWTLFSRYRPELTVFHVSKKRTQVSDEVFGCFRNVLEDELDLKRNIRFKRAIGDDTPGILMDVMRDADLLVLLTKKRSLVSRIFHRSAIRRLSLSSDFPILIFLHQMMND